MNPLHDQLNMALAVLDGEPDAHRILADMFEEHGERGLAQWARGSKSRSNKRLDFVLAVIPYRQAVLLGCDFLEHALASHGRAQRITKLGVEPIRAWFNNDGSKPKFEQAMQTLGGIDPWAFGTMNIDRVTQALHAAVRGAEQAQSCERLEQPRSLHRFANETNDAVRRCAKLCRSLAQREAAQRSWAAFMRSGYQPTGGVTGNSREELRWQLEQTRAAIRSLVEPSQAESRMS